MSLSTESLPSYNKYKSDPPYVETNRITFCWSKETTYSYMCIADKPLIETEARDIQALGFNRPSPNYGFMWFQTRLVDGVFHSVWSSGMQSV